MNVADVIRDVKARTAALYQYAEAHDVFAELEQLLLVDGCMSQASEVHEFAIRVLRAYRAELDDPVPEGLSA